MTDLWQANSANRITASVPMTFEFCPQFLSVISASSGDETRAVISAFAALGSLTLCVG